MPINKPTISHQLKSVRSQKSRQISNICANQNMAFSSKVRSHLISTPQKVNQNLCKQSSSNLLEAPALSNSELKQCTKLLRNVLSSEGENKSTSTDDYNYQNEINSKSVAFKSPDLSLGSDQHNYSANQAAFVDRFDDRTDAESVTSNLDHNSSNINNQSNHNSIHSKTYNNQTIFCSCHSNNNYTMHDSVVLQGSANSQNNEKLSVCSRCHNVIPIFANSSNSKDHGERAYTKSIKTNNEECENGKLSDIHHRNYNSSTQVHNDFKSLQQHGDGSGDKIEDCMDYLHAKINELQNMARVTRDADLSRIIYEIERSIQQMIRENSLLSNHLKTIAKTLKWENSALKQKIKNQSESNRDMKSEFKLIRQEQKQKIEELKLEVQLKTEEIRQLGDREKTNICQLKEKNSALEKEYEQLKSEFQKQLLQSCHKDTDIIQLKHFSTQSETKLKDEIHSLTLRNQKITQDLQVCEAQCKKYEQELSHNQLIIKAAREQVVNLLERHKQNRLESSISCGYRFEPSSELYNSREWINQATNLQHVLSMGSDNKEKQLNPSKENSIHSTIWSANHYSLHQQHNNDQSTVINDSVNNFANTNCNNNYASLSSFNPVHSDSTNLNSNFENSSKLPANFSDKHDESKSPSNISSTLTDRSFNIYVNDNPDNFHEIEKRRNNHINYFGYSDSSSSGLNEDAWNLPQPFTLKKLSSASSMMSTVSSLRSSDDREFRKGLKRLDTQISRLQNTLQSNLQCR